MECYQQSEVATKEPPKPVSIGMRAIPPNFFPWRELEGTGISLVGQVRPARISSCLPNLSGALQVESFVEDVSMDD